MRTASAAGMAAAMLMAVVPEAGAVPPAEPPPKPVNRCQVEESGLAELSGLASDGEAWYAVGDGGSSLRVYVLDPADCSVRDVRSADVNPYDVEDMALAPNGSLWLADTGDNRRRRDNVAIHVLEQDTRSVLYRFTYPDGPHDAEAILLDRSGTPYIVTKETFGLAGIYRPTATPIPEQPVALEQVGSLSLEATDTPGGPMSGSSLNSVLITGGSVHPDGTKVAIRTYTDAYLFSAPDGDLVGALRRPPLRIPLPNEPQGEAIAWEPDGTLLSASERQHPIRAIPDAALLLNTPDKAVASPTHSHRQGRTATSNASEENIASSVPVLLIVGSCAALLVAGGIFLRRRRSR